MSEDKSGLFLHYWRLIVRDGPPAHYDLEAEYRFAPPRRWRFDWAFPEKKVAVEVEGNAWHVQGGGRHMTDGDMDKYNHAAALGWRVLRFSPGMLESDPAGCIEIVKEALA